MSHIIMLDYLSGYFIYKNVDSSTAYHILMKSFIP